MIGVEMPMTNMQATAMSMCCFKSGDQHYRGVDGWL